LADQLKNLNSFQLPLVAIKYFVIKQRCSRNLEIKIRLLQRNKNILINQIKNLIFIPTTLVAQQNDKNKTALQQESGK
jgi:hypothetical protein